MTRRGVRPVVGVLALAIGMSALPTRLLAADGQQEKRLPSVSAAAQRLAVAAPVARAGEMRAQSTGSGGSALVGPRGIVILAVLAAGVGYALYSTKHDRISSPGR